MKIERILRDLHGTTVPMGGTAYRFEPEFPGGPHVATVADRDHAKVFLSIPEGYREYKDTKAAKKDEPENPPVPMLVKPPVTIAVDENGLPVNPQAAIVPADRVDPASLTKEQVERLNPQAPDSIEGVDQQAQPILGDNPGTPPVPDVEQQAADDQALSELLKLPDDKLRQLFESEMDRKPSARAKPDTMAAQILAKRAELAAAEKKGA